MYGSRMYENYVFIFFLYNIQLYNSVSISRSIKDKEKVKINNNK